MARGLEAQLAAFENASDDESDVSDDGDSIDHEELANVGRGGAADEEDLEEDEEDEEEEAESSDDAGYDSEAEAAAAAEEEAAAAKRRVTKRSGLSLGERLKRLEAEKAEKAVTATSDRDLKRRRAGGSSRPQAAKRSSKNAPAEVSSRKRPAATKVIEGLAKKAKNARDPRFEALCGTFNPVAMEQSYGWLDAHEAAEIERKQAHLKTKRGRKDTALKAEVDAAVVRRKQRKHEERKKGVVRGIKRKERQAVKEGKQPYYAKKSVIKQALLDDRFDQLKKSGKLNGFLRKKARKPTSLLEAGARSREARAGAVVPRGAARSD